LLMNNENHYSEIKTKKSRINRDFKYYLN
jgi:hypothetical protein